MDHKEIRIERSNFIDTITDKINKLLTSGWRLRGNLIYQVILDSHGDLREYFTQVLERDVTSNGS